MRHLIGFILTVFFTQEAIAKTNYKPAPQAPAKRVASARRPASISNTRTRVNLPRPAKNWDLSVGLSGGYAHFGSSDATQQATREAGGMQNSFVGSLDVDANFFRYLGLSVEGYFGQGGNGTTTKVDQLNQTIVSEEKKLRQYGGMGTVLGQYPIWIQNTKITPKAGLGYGLLYQESTGRNTDTNATVSKSDHYKGAYVLVGVESWLTPKIQVEADYARSFSADAESNTETASSPAIQSDEASFDRIRAGAHYRVYDNVLLGARYIRRSLTQTTQGNTGSEVTNQVLGSLRVVF